MVKISIIKFELATNIVVMTNKISFQLSIAINHIMNESKYTMRKYYLVSFTLLISCEIRLILESMARVYLEKIEKVHTK